MQSDGAGEAEERAAPETKTGRAGPWLFGVAVIAVGAFFWWLTIYPHGVAPHAS